MKFIKRFWWLFLLGFIVGGVLVWRSNTAKAQEFSRNSYLVKREDLEEMLALSGTIEADENADVRFQTSGLLTWVGVKEGDYVKKYQAIASLDKRELQNSMNQYLNNYMKERWDFEQALEDNENWETRGMTDLARDTIKRTLEKNQFDLNNSVLSVEARNLSLKFATIFAPFEGLITRADVPLPGTNITPSSAVFTVVNPNTLFFSATADQTEIINFYPGMEGKIVLEAFPQTELKSVIRSVGFVPKSGESGTVYEIKIDFSGESVNEKLKLGMTGDADFVLKSEKDVLAVPEDYMLNDNGKYYVLKVEDGEQIRTEVETGETIDGMVVIISGLNENDIIYNPS